MGDETSPLREERGRLAPERESQQADSMRLPWAIVAGQTHSSGSVRNQVKYSTTAQAKKTPNATAASPNQRPTA
jgi:hypothetical protein